MQFNKDKYYQKELQSQISNKIRVKFSNLDKKPIGQFNINTCDTCGFLLLQNLCTYCLNQNMAKDIHPFFAEKLRNQSFRVNLEKKKEKGNSNYILCIDISGSTNSTYLAPKDTKKISQIILANKLGKQNFDALIRQFSLEVINQNLQQIQQYYSWGISTAEIVSNVKFSQENSEMFQFKNSNTKNYISRKQIIQIGIYHFLNELEKKDPEASVYIIYFNQNITLPTNHFEGIEIINQIDDKTPQEMYGFGQYYGQNFEFGNIKQQKLKIINHITKISAQGQTALGPALTFCFGVANTLKKAVNQIIIVTDGCSNVGFGQTQASKNQEDTKKFYENLAIKYGVSNSCIVNLMIFSDQQIGYKAIQEVINKTNGIPYSIEIKMTQNQSINTTNKSNLTSTNKSNLTSTNKSNLTSSNKSMLKSEKGISAAALQNMKNEFNRYLKGHQDMLFESKLSLFNSNPEINLRVDEKHENLINKYQNNLISLYLGIIHRNEQIEFIFSCHNQKKLEKQIKFSLITQYTYKGQKYISIEQKMIQIMPGSIKQAEEEQSKALKREMEKLRLESKDVEKFQKTLGTIKHQKNIHIDQKEFELFNNQFKKLKIQQQQLQKREGTDNVSIKARRRHYQ